MVVIILTLGLISCQAFKEWRIRKTIDIDRMDHYAPVKMMKRRMEENIIVFAVSHSKYNLARQRKTCRTSNVFDGYSECDQLSAGSRRDNCWFCEYYIFANYIWTIYRWTWNVHSLLNRKGHREIDRLYIPPSSIISYVSAARVRYEGVETPCDNVLFLSWRGLLHNGADWGKGVESQITAQCFCLFGRSVSCGLGNAKGSSSIGGLLLRYRSSIVNCCLSQIGETVSLDRSRYGGEESKNQDCNINEVNAISFKSYLLGCFIGLCGFFISGFGAGRRFQYAWLAGGCALVGIGFVIGWQADTIGRHLASPNCLPEIGQTIL